LCVRISCVLDWADLRLVGWLVGVVGLGVEELHQRPRAHRRRVGRFFDPSALVKRAVPRPSGAAPEGYARGVWVSSPVPGEARGNKAVAFHNPQAFSKRMCKKKTLVVHVTRW
jgi:hypothetical protein